MELGEYKIDDILTEYWPGSSLLGSIGSAISTTSFLCETYGNKRAIFSISSCVFPTCNYNVAQHTPSVRSSTFNLYCIHKYSYP